MAVSLVGCRAGLPADAAARVNGQLITKDELNTQMKIYELFFKQPMNNPGSKQQLLDQMVNERLLAEQAKSENISVTDSQVQTELAKFFAALDRQYQTRDESTKKLQEFGLTNDKIAGFIKNYLISQAVVEKKKAGVTVSDEEVRTFYDQNKDKQFTFTEPVVRAAHVLLPLDQQPKAAEVAAKAKAGGDFPALAREYSIDPGSAKAGGDLGYFTRTTMVKEFSDVAFRLQPGEVSDPVRSTFGWHVIKVLDKAGPGTIPFEKAREAATHQLLPQKQDQAVEQWVSQLQKSAKIDKALIS